MALEAEAVVVPEVVQGEDKSLDISLTDAVTGDPFNLTAATEIDCLFLKTDDTCIHKKLTLSEVVITNAPFGRFRILLLIADTALMKLSDLENGVYSDIEIRITVAGKLTIVLLKGVISVVPKLFPAC